METPFLGILMEAVRACSKWSLAEPGFAATDHHSPASADAN